MVADVPPGGKSLAAHLARRLGKTLDVTVKELPGEAQLAKNGSSQPDANDTLQGVAVSDLNSQIRQQYNIDRMITQGAVVTEVEPTSAAAEPRPETGRCDH